MENTRRKKAATQSTQNKEVRINAVFLKKEIYWDIIYIPHNSLA